MGNAIKRSSTILGIKFGCLVPILTCSPYHMDMCGPADVTTHGVGRGSAQLIPINHY